MADYWTARITFGPISPDESAHLLEILGGVEPDPAALRPELAGLAEALERIAYYDHSAEVSYDIETQTIVIDDAQASGGIGQWRAWGLPEPLRAGALGYDMVDASAEGWDGESISWRPGMDQELVRTRSATGEICLTEPQWRRMQAGMRAGALAQAVADYFNPSLPPIGQAMPDQASPGVDQPALNRVRDLADTLAARRGPASGT